MCGWVVVGDAPNTTRGAHAVRRSATCCVPKGAGGRWRARSTSVERDARRTTVKNDLRARAVVRSG